MNEYELMLDRALEKIPEGMSEAGRFNLPEPSVLSEGRTSILENFSVIADYINRDIDHLMKFLLRELGTAGKTEGGRAVFQGRFSKADISNHLENYLSEYVLCSECNKPDTHLTKSGRVLMLKCDACGAHRPVRKQRVGKRTAAPSLEEGGVYEAHIEAEGSKGDGIAKRDRYTIFVPGTKKGDTVRIKINKISGTLAFAELAEE